MNISQIKQAIQQGKTVHWKSQAYSMQMDKRGLLQIKCTNGHVQYATTPNEKGEESLNDDESSFYVLGVESDK